MSISQNLAQLCREFWQASTSGLPKNIAEQSSLEVGEVLIENVSKRFRKRCAKHSGYSTVKSGLLNATSSMQQQKKKTATEQKEDKGFFYALNQASFHVKPGSALGVIGRNGSGKSTLLKLISGIYLPDGGKVQKNGRISALIELGAGFHPDFSGRENIYLGGVMYGLSRKEIDERFDAIVAYSELEDCIDDPVRTYSSGMYMRLGFSLAIHTDPDILLVDEVLAVGDAAFIAKCHDSISELKRRGKTLIFVTHDLSSIERWCDEVVWLDSGVVRERGKPRKVIDAYLAEVEQGQREKLEVENEKRSSQEQDGEELGERWGSKDVEIFDVTMFDQSKEPAWLFDQEESVSVRFSYLINSPVKDLVFGVGIVRVDGLQVHGTNTDIEDIEIEMPTDASLYPVEGIVNYSIDRIGLVDGSYFLDVAAHREDGFSFDYHHRMHKFSVRSSTKAVGVYSPKHSWHIETKSIEEEKRQKVA